MDGGGTSVLRSTLRAKKGLAVRQKDGQTGDFFVFNDKNIALCVNEQPNFLNQEYCKLSYEPNTCAKQDGKDGGKYGGLMLDVQLVITFDDKTLAAMHNATSQENSTSIGKIDPRNVYAVSDLINNDVDTNGIMIVLPCSPGNPMSRWAPRGDLTNETCTNANTLQEDTVNALQFALESTDSEHEFLKDIILWNSTGEDGCNPIDENEYGMVILTSEGCWENVGLFGNTTSGSGASRYIYAVSGLRYDDTNTDGIMIDLPCSPGNPMSRWSPRGDLTSEACTNTLQEDTVKALKFALESSNDENEFLRDIVLWNSVQDDGCNPIDEMEYGMMIMTDEGCWENVHPDNL